MLVPAAPAAPSAPAATAATAGPTDGRLRLVGKGDHLLGLVLRHAPPPSHQWAQWLRLPLASAASDGDAASVEELLVAGADGKAGPRGPDGCTLLHSAAKGGSERVVAALLGAGSGPDVNQRTQAGNKECPLHIAAKLGHSEVAAALVRAGADVNSRDRNDWAPLHLAARFGQLQVVEDLLREGADRDAEDVNGYRPLHYATMWGHPDTIKALLNAGAALESITRVDKTRPLHIAARYASPAIVRDLLHQGAEKNAKNARGFTPLHAAAASNNTGTISLLLAAGADINLASRDQQFTALHLAARRGAAESCSALLGAGASIHTRTLDGSTPMHLASLALKAPAVRLLLRHGADETVVDFAGRTPADVAGSYLIPAPAGGGGGVAGAEHRELIRKIRDRLGRVPADRVWARRGWLVLARKRFAEAAEAAAAAAAATDSDDGGGSATGGKVTDRHGGHEGVGDAGVTIGSGGSSGGSRGPGEKRPCLTGLRRGAVDVSIGGTRVEPSSSSSSSDLFARVASLEKEEIFKSILLFL